MWARSIRACIAQVAAEPVQGTVEVVRTRSEAIRTAGESHTLEKSLSALSLAHVLLVQCPSTCD